MKFSVFAIILAVLAALYGLAFLLFPVQFMQQYGPQLNDDGVAMARFFAGALAGYAVGFWMVRNEPVSSLAARILLWANAVSQVIYLGVTVNGMRNHAVNSLAWSSVVLHVLLLLGCFYFLNSKKTAAAAA